VLLQSVIKDWKTPRAKISNNLSKVVSWLERHRAMIGKCIWGVDVSNNYQRMHLFIAQLVLCCPGHLLLLVEWYHILPILEPVLATHIYKYKIHPYFAYVKGWGDGWPNRKFFKHNLSQPRIKPSLPLQLAMYTSKTVILTTTAMW